MAKTTDASVNTAIDAVATKFGISETEALKVLVSRGAADIAKSVGAGALVRGNKDAFSRAPGGKLVGHELTHVIQQSAAQIKRGK